MERFLGGYADQVERYQMRKVVRFVGRKWILEPSLTITLSTCTSCEILRRMNEVAGGDATRTIRHKLNLVAESTSNSGWQTPLAVLVETDP